MTLLLPERSVVLARLEEMIASHDSNSSANPAIYLVGIDDYEALSGTDQLGTEAAMEEIAVRLDRLVRTADVLGLIEPGLFVLAAASVAPSSAGAVMERIRGAIALPMEIAGQPLSVLVHVTVSFFVVGATAVSMLSKAEAELTQLRNSSKKE
jgi:GGDEF domain-containing protein